MATLTKNTFTAGSAVETLVAAASGGDAVQSLTRQDFLIVKNSNATLSRTVTLNSQEVCNQGHALTPLVITVVALTTQLIKPPAPVSRWKDTNGALQIVYSAAGADLTVGAFTMPD